MSDDKNSACLIIQSKADRKLLAFCILFLWILAGMIANFYHEMGHVVAHLALGDRVYGLWLAPFGGQVLATYPQGDSIRQGIEDLSGLLLSQSAGFLLAIWYSRRRIGRRILPELLFLLIIINLLTDSYTFIVGSFFPIGDSYNAARSWRISPFLFLAPGLVLLALTIFLGKAMALKWATRFYPSLQKKDLVYYSVFTLVAYWICNIAYYSVTAMLYGPTKGLTS